MTHLGAWIDALDGLIKPSLENIQEINVVSDELLADSFISAGRIQIVV